VNGSVSREEIRDWLAPEVGVVDEERGAIQAIVLTRVANGQTVEVNTLFERTAPDAWKSADALAAVLDSQATREAKGLMVPASQYSATIMRGKSAAETKPAGALHFVRMGAPSYAAPGGGLATEGTSPQGVLAQSLRLHEVQAAGYFAGTQALLTAQGQFADRLAQRLEHVEVDARETRIAFLDLSSKLQDKTHQNNIEVLKFARGQIRERELFRLLPALMPVLTGSRVFDEGSVNGAIVRLLHANTDRRLLGQLAESIAAKDPAAGAAFVGTMSALDEAARNEKDEMGRIIREATAHTVSLADAIAEVGGDVIPSQIEAKANGAHTNGAANGAHANGTNGTATPAPVTPESIIPKPDVHVRHAHSLPEERIDAILRELGGDLRARGLRLRTEGDFVVAEGHEGLARGALATLVVTEGEVEIRMSLPPLQRVMAGAIKRIVDAEVTKRLEAT
jgi:hypothetical protein